MQATLTIKLLGTDQERVEIFEDADPQGAVLLGRRRAQQLRAEGYEVENPDGSQTNYAVTTTLGEG